MKRDWWFKFEFNRWRNHTELRRCSLETKGFWIECICVMREIGSDRVTGSYAEIARIIGCFPEEAERCIAELQRTETARVTLSNDCVTLVSRYITKELKAKKQTRLRVAKHRSNAQCNAPVTNRVRVRVINKNKKEEKTNANAGLGDSRPVAVETVRKVGGLYPPKAVWNTIATRLGERPDEDRLRQCFESWVLRGNKPTNYAWATDWYVDGVPDYAKQQKKPPPPPADINSEDYVNKAPRLHFSVMAGVQFSNMEPSEVREIYPKFKSQYLADFPEAESEAVEYERSVEYQQIANGI